MSSTSWAIALLVVKELYRRKDFYVLFILTAVLTVLMGSVSFFNDSSMVRYLKDICLLLIWISGLFMAIATAARQIPAERESRTIFPLLAKPVSRWEMVVGKFAGCWMAVGVCLVVFYAFFAVVSGAREHQWPLVQYFQAMWLQWICLGVVIAFVLFGSVIFATPASNGTISLVLVIGVLLLGRHLNTFALRAGGLTGDLIYVIYYAMPHLEFFDVRDLLIHRADAIPWGPWLVASGYGLVYSAFFLVSCWAVFRRKTLE